MQIQPKSHDSLQAYQALYPRQSQNLSYTSKRFQESRQFQSTIRKACVFTGIGVHSGLPVTMTVCPAPLSIGYVFVRTDIDGDQAIIPALFSTVSDTRMSTTVSNTAGISVSTVEHIIAALAGSGISNAIIEVSGAEIPIMDGSSKVFSDEFRSTGILQQDVLEKSLTIISPVRVESDTGFVEFVPGLSRTFDVYYDFAGRFQATNFENNYFFNLDTDSFEDLLSDARTFGLYEDGVQLQKMGLAKGASLENTVVLKDMAVMNQGGLRSEDEFVRHKVLDAIGDIALAGCSIIGSYRAHNPSHFLNNKLLHALFDSNHSFYWNDSF